MHGTWVLSSAPKATRARIASALPCTAADIAGVPPSCMFSRAKATQYNTSPRRAAEIAAISPSYQWTRDGGGHTCAQVKYSMPFRVLRLLTVLDDPVIGNRGKSRTSVGRSTSDLDGFIAAMTVADPAPAAIMTAVLPS